MDTALEQAIARVVTMMTPAEKARLETKARRARLSVAEFVRRSVDAYDPDEIHEIEQLAELARAFRDSARRASDSVDRANADVAKTIEHMKSMRTS